MFYTIYKTTNLINGKIYIGKHKTENPKDDYLGSGKDFNSELKVFGKENFRKEVLFIFDNEEEMDFKEAELVTWDFVAEDTNYNLCPGGKGGWGYINRTPELKKKASDAAVSKLSYLHENDENWKKETSRKVSTGLKTRYSKISHHSLGSKHTEETKQKMRKTKNSGEQNPNFGTMWITNEIESKQVRKDLLIPIGWRQGRRMLSKKVDPV